MHITQLLRLHLEKELFIELITKYKEDNLNYNKKLFKKLCKKKINLKIQSIKFLSDRSNNSTIDDNKRCCARIWDNHYGSRCKYKRFDGDYCKHHVNMIKRNGKLLFNRYDEEKPLINHQNNRIPWISEPEIEILNKIIKNQWLNLENQIKIDLKKKRYFAPKI